MPGAIDEDAARFLVSDAGRALLEEVAALSGDAAARVLALRRKRRDLPPAVVAAAVEVADARRRARGRFADADGLFFTAEALAQATSPVIAAYHARRLAPFGRVADLGCGVGMDAIALVEAGARVVAIERDPARVIFARANARARGMTDRIEFVVGDVTTLDWAADAVYWDPSRRSDSRRVSAHGDRYEPPLLFLDAIRERVRGGGVKLSPALPDEVLNGMDGVVRFLSDARECKEACVWFGEASEGENVAAAVLLPEGVVAPPGPSLPPVASRVGAFVFDPDPAIVRAGALGWLGEMLGDARRVSADDAYLTGEQAPMNVNARRAARVYRVSEALPYRPRAVTERLRARGIGRLVVKKRHFLREPEVVARDLRLSGQGNEATLILAREGTGHVAILCEPVPE